VYLAQNKFGISDSSVFLNTNKIFGASKWTKGLNEIDFVPGAYFEAAVTIIPGKNKIFIQAISFGINGAFFTKALPIMADHKSYPWQVSLFAGIAIGKKWK
jgi:hypothetical protein